jgi:hypothetical protein
MGGDTMTKGKNAKKEAKKKPKVGPSGATSQAGTINMLNQQPSKKK